MANESGLASDAQEVARVGGVRASKRAREVVRRMIRDCRPGRVGINRASNLLQCRIDRINENRGVLEEDPADRLALRRGGRVHIRQHNDPTGRTCVLIFGRETGEITYVVVGSIFWGG